VPVLDEEELLIVRRVFSVIDEAGAVSAQSLAPPSTTRREMSAVAKDFCRRVEWDNLLSVTGWVKVKSVWMPTDNGQPIERVHWRRPGRGNGVSATTLGWTLSCFSTSVSEFAEYRAADGIAKLNKFEFYAAFWHGGDIGKAEQVASAKGLGGANVSCAHPDEAECLDEIGEQLRKKLPHGDVPFEEVIALTQKAVGSRPAVLARILQNERRSQGKDGAVTDDEPDVTDPRVIPSLKILAHAAMTKLARRGQCVFHPHERKVTTCHG